MKVDQPLDLVKQLYIFQSSLQFCLRAGTERDNAAPSVAAEMARRSHSFGYSVLVNQGLLFGFSIVPLADISPRLRLPCLQELWNREDDGSRERDNIMPAGDLAVPHFSTCSQQTDIEEVILHIDPTPETMLVMTAIATQRVQLAIETLQLTSLTDLPCSEYAQFM